MIVSGTMNFEELLTPREAAKELKLKLSTVRVMVSRKLLETIETRFGRLILKESVELYKSGRLGHPGRPRNASS